ncbi:glycosyltransferase [Lysobacter sp. A289]
MSVLLAAYEFPPSPSPQSLRWAYLCREMVVAGAEVTVIAPRLGALGHGLPDYSGCYVQRTFPGPFMGVVGWLRRLSKVPVSVAATEASPGGDRIESSPGPVTLNWKGRLVECMQALPGVILFPDIRAEWNPWARRAVRRRLMQGGIDVLVTSHEPASVLALGREARRAGVKWVVDLGDPIHASYTPRRWQRRAFDLEREVCRHADHVTVTTEATRELLARRHGVAPNRISVVTQGFDQRQGAAPSRPENGGRLELLYTGSLYSFRRPEVLLEAVAGTPGVRLSIASRQTPEDLLKWARQHPQSVRLLGSLPHQSVLELQRRADVLVDLGNEQVEQVPGKFYEYLGAMKPILYIGPPDSSAATYLTGIRRGWVRDADIGSVSSLLEHLVGLKAAGQLEAGLELGPSTVSEHSWQFLSTKMLGILCAVTGRVPSGSLD